MTTQFKGMKWEVTPAMIHAGAKTLARLAGQRWSEMGDGARGEFKHQALLCMSSALKATENQ